MYHKFNVLDLIRKGWMNRANNARYDTRDDGERGQIGEGV